MTAHAPGTWFLAPSDDYTDDYAAGYDGNTFATREEAEAAIEGLGEAFGDDAEWVAVQRRPDVAAYLAEIVAVGKRYGFSLSHEDHQGGFLVEGWSHRLDQHVLGAQTAEDLLRKGRS